MNIELILILIILVYIYTKSTENYSSVIRSKKIKKYVLNERNFDVYVIHMAKNTERLIHFEKHYKNSDISFKKYNVFSAVVGNKLNLIEYVTPNSYEQILEIEKTLKRKHHYDLTRGAVGCYLSHLSIYKKIIETNIDYAIVFEDDSIMATDFYSRLQYGLSKIPDDWDILLLGLTCLKCDIKMNYIDVQRFWGTHGYIIKNKTAAKLIEYLDKPLSKQIDADISLLIKRKIIRVYGINPIIVAQESSFKSDIQIDIISSKEAFNEEFKQNQLKGYESS
jgi:glycosyl transferase family 25